MNKKLFSLSLLIVITQFNTYAARDYLQALKAKQAAQGEQPEASSSQHPSGFFGFDAHTVVPSSFEPIIIGLQPHLIHTEEASSSNPKPNSDACDDHIAENFDKLMANAQVEEGDCEATISIKRTIKKELLDLKPIIETKKMLALCIEMQKKQKAEQSAKTTQNQDSKQPEASSSL